MKRMRLDKALVALGQGISRTKAQRLITEGHVTVDGDVVFEPSMPVRGDARIAITGDDVPWVSRAALKLLHALDTWDIRVDGKSCLDIGSSTGGFTEVLLSRGASHVIALDVGTGQLAEKLRGDPRVRSIEGVHINDFRIDEGEAPPEIITIDVSFIGLEKVLPRVSTLLALHGDIIALVKPQFEVGKGKTKGGIVVDEELRMVAVERIVDLLRSLGFQVSGPIRSPITGGDGNIEFLLHASR
jgi:23S rRNA (cytidine1920-2'-O)/16S rRNA (cytidine1409-2'-O)-methyltransferase